MVTMGDGATLREHVVTNLAVAAGDMASDTI
jgi:hypothetical protein